MKQNHLKKHWKLEKSVERLETGDLKLDEALTTFEQGIAASRSCGQWLDQARKRVQMLIAEGEEDFQISRRRGRCIIPPYYLGSLFATSHS